MSPWHRRFAELFEALYETGYTLDYQRGQTRPSPFVRVLSVGSTIEAHPMALPSDRLEVVLDRFETFGVGQCQCRMTMQVAGQGCGKPLGNCTVMGQWAEQGIEQGWLRAGLRQERAGDQARGRIARPGHLDHERRVEPRARPPARAAAAAATPCGWSTSSTPRASWRRPISCRGSTTPSAPSAASAPRTARWARWRSTCRQRQRKHLRERCIGCGLCVVACGDRRAVAMEPVPDYKLPYKSWFSYQFHSHGADAPRGLEGVAKPISPRSNRSATRR